MSGQSDVVHRQANTRADGGKEDGEGDRYALTRVEHVVEERVARVVVVVRVTGEALFVKQHTAEASDGGLCGAGVGLVSRLGRPLLLPVRAASSRLNLKLTGSRASCFRQNW